MTHKLKRPVAFLSAFVMVMAMLLYFPGGTSSLDFGLKASAATITPTEPSTNSNGVYRIGTAAELYWFAKLVNNGNKSANAVLTDNITMNTNVLVNGTLNSNTDNFTSWTPIGKNTNAYTGTFDGQGYTISGLYLNDSNLDFVGLFGYAGSNGTVKNVGVVDSYFNGG